MKTAKFLKAFNYAVVSIGILLLLSALSSCDHKSNSEDDTFKQSIVDDPGRAKRKAEEARMKDSIRLGDTAVVDEDKH